MTNPFDVIKTRRQAAADAGASASASSNRTFTLLRTIVKQEGYAGLFSGLTPRLAKVGGVLDRLVRESQVADSKGWLDTLPLFRVTTHRSDLHVA